MTERLLNKAMLQHSLTLVLCMQMARVCFRNGEGVLQDDKEAIEWYRKAAEQGRAIAQFNLGRMYENSAGVVRSYVTAHVWYNLAGIQGHEKARKYPDRIAEKMTPAQIAEAQRLAREWKPKKTD
jgi:TPR repeat protein